MPSAMFRFELFGDKELENALAELPKSVAKPVLTSILMEAAQPIVAVAKVLAPPDDPDTKGSLKEGISAATSLTKRQRSFSAKNGVTVFIGPSNRNPAFRVGHLNEFGTGPRYHKSGKYVGVMPAKPFMRPAWDSTKDRALQIIRQKAWEKILAAAKKLRAKAEAGTLGKTVTRQLLR